MSTWLLPVPAGPTRRAFSLARIHSSYAMYAKVAVEMPEASGHFLRDDQRVAPNRLNPCRADRHYLRVTVAPPSLPASLATGSGIDST